MNYLSEFDLLSAVFAAIQIQYFTFFQQTQMVSRRKKVEDVSAFIHLVQSKDYLTVLLFFMFSKSKYVGSG